MHLSLLLILIIACNLRYSFANVCMEKDEFRSYCTSMSTRASFMEPEGPCYFEPPVEQENWNGAWQSCQNKNASLVSVHSSAQLNFLIENFFVVNPTTNYITALKRNPGTFASGYADKYYWYEDANAVLERTTISATWIGKKLTSGPIMEEDCFFYQYETGFAVTGCEETFKVLCVLTNRKQTYEPGFFAPLPDCINDAYTVDLPGATIQDCAKRCSEKDWCWSFNYYASASDCQLFTWNFSQLPVNPTEGPATGTMSDCVTYRRINRK